MFHLLEVHFPGCTQACSLATHHYELTAAVEFVVLVYAVVVIVVHAFVLLLLAAVVDTLV